MNNYEKNSLRETLFSNKFFLRLSTVIASFTISIKPQLGPNDNTSYVTNLKGSFSIMNI